MADLDYARVIGRFALSVADTTVDTDDDPDTVWCTEGRVVITPLNTFVKVAGVAVPFTMGGAVIEATIDSQGFLTHLGKRSINVVDLTSPKVNPRIGPDLATHRVEFINVMAGDTPVPFPRVEVRLTAAGADGSGTNDLTLVAPVLPGEATPIYRGEQGTSVESAEVEGGELLFTFTDGTTQSAGELPVGPGGSDAGVADYVRTPGTETAAALSATFGRLGPPSGGDDTAMIQAALDAFGAVTAQMGATYLATALHVPDDVLFDINAGVIKKHSGSANLITLGNRARVRSGFLDANSLGGSLVYNPAVDAGCEVVAAINGGPVSVAFDHNAAVRPHVTECTSDGFYYGVLGNAGTVDLVVSGGWHRNGRAKTSYEGSVYLPSARRSQITAITVEAAAGHGYYDSGIDNMFTSCIARSCGTPGNFDHRGATTDGSVRSKWVGCSFNGNAECGFYDRNISIGTTLTGCHAVGNNTAGRPGGNGYEMLGKNYSLTGCLAEGSLVGPGPSAGAGFYLGGAGQATGCRSIKNNLHGFYIYDATHVSLHDWVAIDNGQGDPNADGVNIHGSYPGATTGITVGIGQAYDTQATKTQRYGIAISNAVDYYTVADGIDARAANHRIGGVIDAGGTHRRVPSGYL